MDETNKSWILGVLEVTLTWCYSKLPAWEVLGVIVRSYHEATYGKDDGRAVIEETPEENRVGNYLIKAWAAYMDEMFADQFGSSKSPNFEEAVGENIDTPQTNQHWADNLKADRGN